MVTFTDYCSFSVHCRTHGHSFTFPNCSYLTFSRSMGSLHGKWMWSWRQPESSGVVRPLWRLDHPPHQLLPVRSTRQPAELLQSVWLAQRPVWLAARRLEPVCPGVDAQLWDTAPHRVLTGRGGHPDSRGGLCSESRRGTRRRCNLWVLWA